MLLILNLSDISLLKASERKRTELLNFVSHDLRSPLVSLTALLDLARNEENATELVKLLDRMQSYTDKTLSLAEQFLQLARAESSEGFVFQDVDMITIALNAVEQVAILDLPKELLIDLGTTVLAAGASRVTGRALLGTDEDVFLRFGHDCLPR